MDEAEKKHLSEVIDYDSDVAPYQFIKIYAGVGSGKNTFIDNLVRGGVLRHKDGTLVEKKNVLLVTSRRAKADEQRNLPDVSYDFRMGMYDYYDYPFYFFDDDDDLDLFLSEERVVTGEMGESRTIRLRSCCCTNAQIETMWQKYLPQSTQTHPWERFDMIVIDEVHAVLADASYQSSPYYVRRLIEETLKRSAKCKVLVMTGSPEILSDYPLFNEAHCIDCMDSCVNLTPANVVFLDSTQAFYKLKDFLNAGQKTVYFSNTIKNALIYAKSFPDHQDNIAVSYSDEDKRRKLKSDNKLLFDSMVAAETCLAVNKKLPDNIHLFLTTAKNKEGINIENSDIRTLFVEAHTEHEIKQMTGRLRMGVETLYIVIDPAKYNDSELTGEHSFSAESGLLDAINLYYIELCGKAEYYWEVEDSLAQCEVKLLANYIEFIHEKFPYIRFDYATNEFVYYKERAIGRAYYDAQNELFEVNVSRSGLSSLAHTWFPKCRCKIMVRFLEEARVGIREYLRSKNWMNHRVANSHKDEILSKINELTGTELKQLKRALNMLGLDMRNGSHNNTYGSFIITENTN